MLECNPLDSELRTFNPVSIETATRSCVEQQRWKPAAELFLLAEIYVRFDTARIADPAANERIQELGDLVRSTFTPAQRDSLTHAIHELEDTPDSRSALCAEIRAVGPPDYDPDYLTYELRPGPTQPAPVDPGPVKNFDPDREWAMLLNGYLECPA